MMISSNVYPLPANRFIMIKFLLELYCLAFFTSCWTSLVWAKPFNVPDIISYGKPADWFYVEYEQSMIINNITHGSQENILSVEEYFNLDSAVSIAFQRNKETNNRHVLVAFQGHFYHCRVVHEDRVCTQDLRQDHTSIYPWRYSTRHKISKSSKALVGIGAIWKNALDRQMTCGQGSVNESICSFADRYINWVITFTAGSIEGRPRIEPSKIKIQHYYTIHEDGKSIVDCIATEIYIKSLRILPQLAEEEERRIQDIIGICNHLETFHRPTFPSLLRTIGESAQKNYHISYRVIKPASELEGSKLVPAESYSIEEWFSYTEKVQSFRTSRLNRANTSLKHQYYRLLGLKNRNRCVSFEVELINGEPILCRFRQFDDENLSKTPMFQRPVRFIDHEELIGDTMDYHEKNLLGLGALLSNIYHSQHKYLNYVNKTFDGSVALNEWIADDSERSGQRFHLIFKRPTNGDISSCHLSSLSRIDVYRKNLDGPTKLYSCDRPSRVQSIEKEEAKSEKVMNYSLDVSIEVYSYTTYLYPSDKRQAFIIPEDKCPTVEDVSDDNEDDEEIIKKTDRGVFELATDSEDFIDFYEILALERNYRISSTWRFESGRVIKLVEHLYFDDDMKVARIDLDSEDRYYICYATGKIFSFYGEVCELVDSLDEDLEEYSSPMDLYGLADHCSLHHYGLGNLLKLPSREELSSIEFLGNSISDDRLHKQWKIRLNDLNKDAIFHFVVEKEASGDLTRMSLESVSVKESNEPVLLINGIKITYADASDVVIPSACNVTSERRLNQQDFPTFERIFSKGPKEATFSIFYYFLIHSKGSNYNLTVVESCAGHGDCMINMWDHENIIELKTRTEYDGSVDTIVYDHQRQLCTKCTSLMDLFGLNEIVKSLISHDDHRSLDDSALLIVNLWQIFGDTIAADKVAPTEEEINLDGQMYLRFEWKIENQVAKISFEFDKKLEAIDAPLTLSTILIHLVTRNETMRFSFYHLSPGKSIKWPLPESCETVLDQNRYIPVLCDASKESKMFYMRSQQVLGGRIQQLDEWYENKTAYRIKISNLVDSEINIVAEYLVLRETGELFNLTVADECDLIAGQRSIEWFNDQILELQNEAKFYGPLFLWSLAEDCDTRVRQVPDDRMNFDVLFDRDYRTNLFNTELWSVERLSSPLLQAILRFGRDGVKREMPENIQVMERFLDGSDHRGIASLEVLNLLPISRSLNLQHKHMLLVPKGRGCKRSRSAHDIWASGGLDSYDNHSNSLTRFEYLASLSQVRDGRWVPSLKIQTGFVSKCRTTGSPESLANLKMSHWQVQDIQAGTMTSYRQVQNRIAPRSNHVQTRLLDENTGRCMLVGPLKTRQDTEILSLDLAVEAGESIHIKDSLLTSYEINESGFEPIHRYEDDEGSIVSVYEYRTSRVELNPRLIGPGSIIRTLVRTKTADKDQTEHYWYTSLKLEVILLGKAHLVLNINSLGEQDCFGILTEARTQDCHMSTDMDQVLRDAGIDTGNRMRQVQLYFAPVDNSPFAGTPESTWAKSNDIARSLGLKFITEEDAINPMQLGDIDVIFHKDSLISAYITLMEPSSPVHAFQQVPEKVLKRFGSKMLLHTRVMQSLYDCSEWCGSMNHCAAFSYCTDNMCSILTGMDTGSENFVESYGDDKSTCSLYHKCPELSSKPISEIIGLIQQSIVRDDQINKFSFMISSEGNASIQYIARKIEMVFDDGFPEIGNEDGEQQNEKHTFVTLKTDRAFLLEGLKSLASISFELRRSLSECLKACDDVGATLCSYCTRSGVCRAVTNVTSWKDYNEVENDSDEDYLNRCTIYSIDYTKDYHRLTDRPRPSKYLSAEKNLGLIECAAMCSLGKSQEQTKVNLSECLSFDYCLDATTGETTCYMQQNHITMTDFGETTYASELAPDDKCYHYSKNLVSDFLLIKEKKFKIHEAYVRTHMTLDRCATLCHLDPEEDCMGFEYCHKDETQTTSCHIKRFRSDHTQEVNDNDSAHAELIDARGCSVYLLKNNSLDNQYTINDQSISDSISNKADNTCDAHNESLIHLGLVDTIILSFLGLILGIGVRNALLVGRSRCASV